MYIPKIALQNELGKYDYICANCLKNPMKYISMA